MATSGRAEPFVAERYIGAHASQQAPHGYPPQVRKVQFFLETTLAGAAGEPVGWPSSSRVAVAAVLKNPFSGTADSGGDALAELGERIASSLVPELKQLLKVPALCYGKAVIVGTSGTLEQGAALIHPRLGAPVRAGIGGGKAVIPSNNKVAASGSSIDIPLGHKDDAWSFAHIDTLTLAVNDAPLADEMVLFLALAAGTRPHAEAPAQDLAARVRPAA
jgi:Amino acid synthesis